MKNKIYHFISATYALIELVAFIAVFVFWGKVQALPEEQVNLGGRLSLLLV